MKKTSLDLIGIASLLCSGVTCAGTMGAVASASGYGWNSYYAGLNGGYSWSNANTQVLPLPTPDALPPSYGNVLPVKIPVSMTGGILGLQVGHNWHLNSHPKWVVGLEADINWIPLTGSAVGNEQGDAVLANAIFYSVLSSSQKTSWFGTLRPRVGFLVKDALLVYATGGLAYGDMNERANTNYLVNNYGNEAYPASQSNTNIGWTAGGGLEWAMRDHWSAKLEYLYYDLGRTSSIGNPIIPNPPFQVKYTWTNAPQVVRIGLNYLV